MGYRIVDQFLHLDAGVHALLGQRGLGHGELGHGEEDKDVSYKKASHKKAVHFWLENSSVVSADER